MEEFHRLLPEESSFRPHWEQNRATVGTLAPQEGQDRMAVASFHCARRSQPRAFLNISPATSANIASMGMNISQGNSTSDMGTRLPLPILSVIAAARQLYVDRIFIAAPHY
jgi:hypothetical protein